MGETRLHRALSWFGPAVVAWVIWVIATHWIVQPFAIPSESMAPTLGVGDRVLAERLSTDPQRGDIVVFSDPGRWAPQPGALAVLSSWGQLMSSRPHLVKRVVGLGGDHLECKTSGPMMRNGKAVSEPYLNGGPACTQAFSITVPRGSMWVMGDNRANSADSRAHDDGSGRMGSVKLSRVTGTVSMRLWPLSDIGIVR